MPKSATEVMQDAIAAAVIDGIVALRDASKGMPNTLLRDISTVHANTAVADLPEPLRASIAESVRTAFSRFLKEGYSVAPANAAPRPPAPRPQVVGRGERPQRPAAPRGPGRPGDRPSRPGGPSGDRPRGGGGPRGGPTKG